MLLSFLLLFTYISVSLCLFIYLSIYLYMSSYLYVRQSVCLSICLSVYLSVCLFVCLSIPESLKSSQPTGQHSCINFDLLLYVYGIAHEISNEMSNVSKIKKKKIPNCVWKLTSEYRNTIQNPSFSTTSTGR